MSDLCPLCKRTLKATDEQELVIVDMEIVGSGIGSLIYEWAHIACAERYTTTRRLVRRTSTEETNVSDNQAG